jgi:hypothetical protein
MKLRIRALIAVPVAVAAFALAAAPAFAGSADQQIADAGLVVASDVPATWTSSPADAGNEKANLRLAAKTKGCREYVKFATVNEAATNAQSDDYASATDEQISNNSYVHKREAIAARTLDAFASPTVPDCLSTVFTKLIETQLAKDPQARRSIRGVSLELAPVDLGDTGLPTVAYEGTLSIELRDGTSQDTDIGLIAVQVDRVVLTYSIQAPPDSAVIQGALETALTNTITRTAGAL